MFNKILVPNHSTGRSDNGRISDCKGRERGGGRRAAGVSSNKSDETFEMFIFSLPSMETGQGIFSSYVSLGFVLNISG